MDQTPSQIRNGELAKWRSEVIAGLLDLIDVLRDTTHEQFPTPDIFVSVDSKPAPTDDDIYYAPALTQGDVRRAMAVSPGYWSKLQLTNQVSYTKALGDAVRVHFYVNRGQFCTRIQTGTKHVEAVEAHDEPVYEWQCDTPEIEV